MVFRTERHFRNHCRDHRIEVGAADCDEYALMALDFITKPKPAAGGTLHECKRNHGDIVHYDSTTEEYCVLAYDGFLRTYMKPTTAWHGLASNMEYFQRECHNH